MPLTLTLLALALVGPSQLHAGQEADKDLAQQIFDTMVHAGKQTRQSARPCERHRLPGNIRSFEACCRNLTGLQGQVLQSHVRR
jgi:hypothetical protein